MKEQVRIASGQGFWGDLPQAPAEQITGGPVDYLVLDYLAEVTMSILQKQKMRDPDKGYATDFIDMLDELLPELISRGIRVVANAGGVNPHSCKDEVLKLVRKHGLSGVTVAVVEGDDILDRVDELLERGHGLNHMETGRPLTEVRERLLSANVYLGSRPVAEALGKGADIVITGRVIDAALALGPLIHEFEWDQDDHDLLAAGIIAGHLIECGAQVSGGNFTDWQSVGQPAFTGFPLVEVDNDGRIVITKHPGTGGLVNELTVKEQLLYEIGDPARYITPDVIVDFTSLQLRETGDNRVEVTGARGHPPTDTYKVSASYRDGFRLTTSLIYSAPDAVGKAMRASDILQERARALGIEPADVRTELVGVNACSERPFRRSDVAGLAEVQLRVSARDKDRRVLEQFGRQVPALLLTGPGGVTGYSGGRPRASEIVAFWPALLSRQECRPSVSIFRL